MIERSCNVEDTERIAARLALTLRGGECVTLSGDLGAGKTQFVRGMVRALGGDAALVCSPTFVLLHIYDCPAFKVFHWDAYRVSGPTDFEATGFSETLQEGGLVIVEWPERVAALLPPRCISVRITVTGETSRRIDIDE
ncbi:MAG: tRNA (adenosine(37)-N6)-threonylcarbamoyltransferase complex ATPase subunit type 1 TsaE [Phycisphaerae bacterium]|nr:tRNA (adenosine(37)-N6)-threonylcarbamoyltransferase complex ATPase subunit type 1 TsaE [Phycisphaerae bacterium]MDW8263484.1 tRNA (adenosine(37)-N6)-threonylcarbamoyltransferase complex ATPase subunit type 1 TsaE [Phycisphaerales bacterium]